MKILHVNAKSAQQKRTIYISYIRRVPRKGARPTGPNRTQPHRTEPCWTGLGVPQLPELCCCQRGFCAAVTTHSHKETQRHAGTHTLTDTLHKDTHRDRANNNRNSSTQRCPQLILYACPLSSSHSLSLSTTLSHCLALCDVTSVELTYTWGFCETMFLNQIKIRNEHFTRHCICFAVNFTFPECSPSSPVSPRIREP